MPKKWYAVTAGREIGVFEDWLEAAAAVKGLDDAIYKGYNTEEEAEAAFAAQERKGNTQIIRDGRRFQPSPAIKNTEHLVNVTPRTGSNASPRRLSASASLPAQLRPTPPQTPDMGQRYSPSVHSGSVRTGSPAMRSSASNAYYSPASTGFSTNSVKTAEERAESRARIMDDIKKSYEEDSRRLSERRAEVQRALTSSPRSSRNSVASTPGSVRSFHTPDSDAGSSPSEARSRKPIDRSNAPKGRVHLPEWCRTYPQVKEEHHPVKDEPHSPTVLLSPLNLLGPSTLTTPMPWPSTESTRRSPLVKSATEPILFSMESSTSFGGRASSRTSGSIHSQKGNGHGSEVQVDPRSPMLNNGAAIRDVQYRSPIAVADKMARMQI